MTTSTTPIYVSVDVFKASQFNGMAFGDMATASAFCSQYSALLESTVALLCPGFTLANKDTIELDASVRLTLTEVFKYLEIVLDSVDIVDDDARAISLRIAIAALSSFWDAMIKINILTKLI